MIGEVGFYAFLEKEMFFFLQGRDIYMIDTGHINNFKTQSNQKKVQCNEKQIGKGVESLFQTMA
jgi:hypothetical protein